MNDHLLLLMLFAVSVSVVLAAIQRDTAREQARLALWLTAGFIGVALALGWLMYPFPL